MILLVSLVFVKLRNHFEHSIRTSFNYRNCFHKKSSTSLKKKIGSTNQRSILTIQTVSNEYN